ncbi:META domain-containing protein [Carboxylicivirga sediminis]|uniref:META domain-containing protein n=1 Tax=Carboxylicivirga sediminis TaxID=2006564 RepID=A0A941FAR0_9BACT|nr:META domain-containing protein [Carboxylicivirga sediminis]MBR8538024.1 META domain-containing protein [Carboxylicivirga sediminis]
MKKLFVALMAVAALVSCKSTQGTSQEKASNKQNISELFVEANQWELISFNGQAAKEAGFTLKTPTLVINMAENKAGGNSGCNSFGGEVVIEGNTLTIDKVFSTKMYCDGVPEIEFFQMLQQTLNYTIKGEVLQLEKDGQIIMEFKLKAESAE